MSVSVLPRPDPTVVPELLRHVPSLGVLALIALLFASVGSGLGVRSAAVAPGQPLAATLGGRTQPEVPRPESDPRALLPISAAEAFMRNAAVPVDAGPNPAAAAFTLPADEVARMRSIDCLTAAIYYEAGQEPADGQRAVAQVVLNRVRHPHYPKTVCGVVFQGHQRVTGCQFTFTCDGALRRTPVASLWERARRVAQEALGGYVHRAVGWATHYHANYVFPYWATSLSKVATIGAHIFYRWDTGGRLSGRYAGSEPDIQWRGGFGQPDRAALAAAGAAAIGSERDAAAAAAAAAAQAAQQGAAHSVDSFQRAILRRYEPVNSESAARIIQDRVDSQAPSTSSRWSITGQPGPSEQRPLGREGTQAPVVLDGVRRRPAAEPAAPPPPAAAQNDSQAR